MAEFKDLDGKGQVKALYAQVGELLSGHLFSIPVNQRQYVWSNKEIDSLLRDLSGKGAADNFFGQLILTHNGNRYSVVDGQQRLTTFSLLAVAMVNAENQDKTKWKLSPSQKELIKDILNSNGSTRIQGIQAHPFRVDPNTSDPFGFLVSADASEFEERCNILRKAGKESPCFRIADNCVALRNHLGKVPNQVEFDALFDRSFKKATVLALLFNHSGLATSLFDGINARGKKLEPDEILKNKFCSIIGFDPVTGYPDVEAGKEFANQWELLEKRLLDCRSLFGAKFPVIKEYLAILLSVYLQDGSIKESEVVSRFEQRFEMHFDNTHQERINSAVKQRKDARQLLKIATQSLGTLQQQAQQATKQGLEIRYSLESIGTAMGAMYGFSMPLAYLFAEEANVDSKVLAKICQVAEIATFRLLKTKAMTAGAYKSVMVDNAITLFQTGDVSDVMDRLRESLKICSDPNLKKYLTTESFKDASLAFYVVNKLGRLHSRDQRQYFMGNRDQWEVEHITPQKMAAYWGFTNAQEQLFKEKFLHQLGNLLVTDDELNGHVKNHRIDFKLNGNTADICEQNCHRHYVYDSVYVRESQDFSAWRKFELRSKKFSESLGSPTVKVAKGAGGIKLKQQGGSDLFNAATEFVNKRTQMLANRAVVDQIWSI